MGQPSHDHERVDAGFDRVVAVRRIHRHWAEYCTPDYWRALNPHLTISDTPCAHLAPLEIPQAVVDDCRDQLASEGFFVTPPVITEARMAPVRRAITTLAEHEIPTGFACLYDEYYQLFEGLQRLVEPILGEGYRWVTQGNWAFFVPPGDPALSGLTAASPHRDSMGPDPRIMAGELPGVLTVWVPLTDVTPEHSCIYVVPKDVDPDFLTDSREVLRKRIALRDVRAVPAAAGSILGWSTHLAHWGSRSSPRAPGPRISVSMYFQRADDPPCHPSAFNPGDPYRFADRLRWTIDAVGAPRLLGDLDWSVLGPT